MKLAVDVQYTGDESARVAGVLFSGWADNAPVSEYTVEVTGVAPYVPGEFYKREMPCILALYAALPPPIDLIILDAYVDLGPDHPGLGRRLYDHFGGAIPVIGVAKTRYAGATPVVVGRHGTSPLYVTAAGVDPTEAARQVFGMHGDYRIPTLLKRADSLARGHA